MLNQVLTLAQIPEHSLPLMRTMSGGEGFVIDGYLFLKQADWLLAIGYPLDREFVESEFRESLKKALQQSQAKDCFGISPELIAGSLELDRDVFYVLSCEGEVPRRLIRPIARARESLRFEMAQVFSAKHRKLWAEFMGRVNLKPQVAKLFAQTEDMQGIEGIEFFNAWNEEGQLIACLVIDSNPGDFCSYIIGAHSKEYYVPHAVDFLFEQLLLIARERGKKYIHLGLGVNEGIRRFKMKWGGVPAQNYSMWQYQGQVDNSQVTDFMTALLSSSDLSKRQILAALPQQKPFAMLWSLEGGMEKSYIAGTAHFFCYSFENSLEKLFNQVDTVIFEGPLDPESLKLVQAIGQDVNFTDYPQGETLKGLLSPEQIKKLKVIVQGPQHKWAHFFNYAYKNPVDVDYLLNDTRHWYAFFSLWTGFLARQGWEQSVDLEAHNLAVDMGKTVISMESIPEQIASLELAPVSRIVNFINNCDLWPKYIKRNVKAYLAGDLLSMLGTSTEFPSRTEQIIDHRDQRFRERMAPFIKRGRTAVFVGAAHMLNLRGMLAEDGFTVNQVLPKRFWGIF